MRTCNNNGLPEWPGKSSDWHFKHIQILKITREANNGREKSLIDYCLVSKQIWQILVTISAIISAHNENTKQ